MKFVKKLLAVLFVAILALSVVSGISFAKRPSVDDGTKALLADAAAQTLAPKKTSEEINCYVFGDTLCDSKGQLVTDYKLDKNRNIVDENGAIVVLALDTTQFSYVSDVEYDKSQLRQNLDTETLADGSRALKPTRMTLSLNVVPSDPVNKTITLQSYDPEALYFPYNANQGIMADQSAPASVNMRSVTVEPDADGNVKVSLMGLFQGHVSITVKNVMGEVVEKMDFVLTSDIPETTGVLVNDKTPTITNPGTTATGTTSTDASSTTPGTTGTGSTGTETGTGVITPHQHVFRAQVMEPTARTQGYTLHVCEICGQSYRDTYTPVLSHSHNWRVLNTVPATYKTQGYTVYQCTECLETENRDFTPVLVCKHVVCSSVEVPATCTTGGYTEHECLVCRDYSYRDNEVPALGHIWDQGTEIRKATCEHEGLIEYHCTGAGCTETKQSIIPILSHDWDEGVVTKAATCTEDGVRTFTCKSGGETRTEVIPALGHAWDDGVVTKEATCDEVGILTYTCAHSNETRTEEIPALGHDWDEGVVTKEPTCAENGVLTFTCRTCGDTKNESIEKLSHTWDDGVVTLEPTCSEPGIKTYTCTVCNETKTEVIPTVAHTMVDEVVAPTYTSQGYTKHFCSVCGYETEHTDITEPLPHEHDYELSDTDPTCTEPGHAIYVCTICGGTCPAGDNETGEIDPLGHDYQITQVEATTSSQGYIMHTCSRCGDTFYTDFVPAKVPYSESEDNELDINAVAEAGKKWLRDNGYTVSESADLPFLPTSVSLHGEQSSVEYLAVATCQDTVFFAQRQCEAGKQPVFNVVVTVYEEANMVQITCYYGYVDAPGNV